MHLLFYYDIMYETIFSLNAISYHDYNFKYSSSINSWLLPNVLSILNINYLINIAIDYFIHFAIKLESEP